MICENCKREHDGSFGSGRFCSRSCANRRVHSEETKQKMSDALIGKPSKLSEEGRQRLVENGVLQKRLQDERRELDFGTLSFNELVDKYNKSQWLHPRLRERVKEEQNHTCERCGNHEWQGSPIPVEVHHKDGTKIHYRENLEVLCLNCHGQTKTWKVKNEHRG